jgi:RNA polymerase sigma-70 factor (ECF subfamily)
MQTEELWRQFHDELLAFLRRRLPGEADAEEVIQQVFLQIHQQLKRSSGPRHARGWVYQITRNAIVDHFRRSRGIGRGEPADMDVIEIEHRDQRSAVAEYELTSCMRPLVDSLPEPYRQAIQWTELEGITQFEAAKRAGISVAGMKSRVQRGRNKLKDALLACCKVELDRRRTPIDVECTGPCEYMGRNDPDRLDDE